MAGKRPIRLRKNNGGGRKPDLSDEYLEKCERACVLIADGSSYRSVAAEMKVSIRSVQEMVQKYLALTAKLYRGPQVRGMLNRRFDRLFSLTMREYVRLDSMETVEGRPTGRFLVRMDEERRIELKELLFRRMESIAGRVADMYKQSDVGGGQEEERPMRELPSVQDQRKLRRLAREVRGIIDVRAVEEASFTVEGGNGSGNGSTHQGNGSSEDHRDPGSTPPV